MCAAGAQGDRDWARLRRWLEETYGSSDPARVHAFEQKALARPGWRFFYGALNVPTHAGGYAVGVHNGCILQGEAGLAEFVRDQDVHGRPSAIPAAQLAATAMFFLSHYGAGDAMLITDAREEGKAWSRRIRKHLREPTLSAEGEGYRLEFWYLQRLLIRVILHIRPGNALEYEKVSIIDLLESKNRSSGDG